METISNQARVTYSYEGTDETFSNRSNIVNTAIKDNYSICVEKTSTSDCFRPGETITYMIRVKNNGCRCLSRLEIVDVAESAEYMTYVAGSARLFIDGSMEEITPTGTSPLAFDIDDRLERDEGFILQYNMVVSDDISADILELVNTVTVTAYYCECCSNSTRNNSIEESDTLSIPRCDFAEVLITKAVSNDNLCCGEELEYIITLTNTGNVDATNVVVTDQLPESFVVTEIHSENNGETHHYDSREYDIDDSNFLTLPNENGTIISVPAVAPGVDNSTTITIHGHM